jgi:glutathione S-transferase
VQYLASRYGGGTMIGPEGPVEAALCMQWSLWAITECEAAILSLMTKGQMGAPTDQEQAAEKLKRPLQALEDSLEGKDFLVGGR